MTDQRTVTVISDGSRCPQTRTAGGAACVATPESKRLCDSIGSDITSANGAGGHRLVRLDGVGCPSMRVVAPEQLSAAIEQMHGGVASFVQSVPVTEHYKDAPVWEGVVHVFDLADNPNAARAYA